MRNPKETHFFQDEERSFARSSLIGWLAIAAAILMVGLFAFFLYRFGGNPGKTEARAASGYAYLLREYEGQIGIFPRDSDTPREVLDVSIDLLPAYDQRELRTGVEVADDAALARAIEDYTS